MGEFDADMVIRRLQLMQELLSHLEGIGEPSEEMLAADLGLRLQIERAISQLVNLAIDVNTHVAATHGKRVPSDGRESFDLASAAGAIDTRLARKVQQSVGLRNILIHEYVRLDLGILAAAVPTARREFGEYLQQVADFTAGASLGRRQGDDEPQA